MAAFLIWRKDNMSQMPKAPDEIKGNLSNDQREAKQEGFAAVFNKAPDDKPKQNSRVKANPVMRKMFNALVKLNEQYFSESDSEDINTIVVSAYLKGKQEEKILSLNEDEMLDEDFDRLQIRIDKLDKKIDNARKNLNLTLNTKFRLANELYKSILEEKKIAAIENQNKPQMMDTNLASLVNRMGANQNGK